MDDASIDSGLDGGYPKRRRNTVHLTGRFFPVLNGVPLNPNHLRSPTCCTADSEAAPDTSILSKTEDDTKDCGEPVSFKAFPGRERRACWPGVHLDVGSLVRGLHL